MFFGFSSFGGYKFGGWNKGGWSKSKWGEKSWGDNGWADKGWGHKKWAKKKSWCDDRDDAPIKASWTQKSCDKKDFKFDFGTCKPITWGCRDDDDRGGHKGWKKKQWEKQHDWKKGCGPIVTPEEEIEEANTAPEITAPGDTNITVHGFSAGTFAADVDAVDADGDTLVFSIVDDPSLDEDGDIFEIDPATGVVTVGADGVHRASADGDTEYTVVVEVTDGEATDTIELQLMVDFLAA
ncbi:MAG: cadherin repeat domain-containing protein [Pseudomonadota bacterium]